MSTPWRPFIIPARKIEDYPLYAKRIEIQEAMCRHAKIKGTGFENKKFLHKVLHKGLEWTGLDKLGLKNVLDLQVLEQDFELERLPESADGLRILHLSDLHLDGVPGLLEVLLEKIAPLSFDLCVITGDFRFGKRELSREEIEDSLSLIEYLSKRAKRGVYITLGNHDFIEQVKPFEEAGARVLMNENLPLDEEAQLWLIGLDDPHLYFCADFENGFKGVPEEACKILLVHSPEVTAKAERYGTDLYLCGHTHGGQIKIPFLGAPFSNARCERRYAFAGFERGRMKGYTHNGTGASSVAARFYCPSEMVIHCLRRKT